jgi:hypothetical protein
MSLPGFFLRDQRIEPTLRRRSIFFSLRYLNRAARSVNGAIQVADGIKNTSEIVVVMRIIWLKVNAPTESMGSLCGGGPASKKLTAQ